ncbi:hypothetical protein FS749_000181 [Ceratobasidium sp. UAMH 11750]|nr:hypothetical protein FS749_000181 [Ceratobasidium sp. UAMH 11750]
MDMLTFILPTRGLGRTQAESENRAWASLRHQIAARALQQDAKWAVHGLVADPAHETSGPNLGNGLTQWRTVAPALVPSNAQSSPFSSGQFLPDSGYPQGLPLEVCNKMVECAREYRETWEEAAANMGFNLQYWLTALSQGPGLVEPTVTVRTPPTEPESVEYEGADIGTARPTAELLHRERSVEAPLGPAVKPVDATLGRSSPSLGGAPGLEGWSRGTSAERSLVGTVAPVRQTEPDEQQGGLGLEDEDEWLYSNQEAARRYGPVRRPPTPEWDLESMPSALDSQTVGSTRLKSPSEEPAGSEQEPAGDFSTPANLQAGASTSPGRPTAHRVSEFPRPQ